MKGLPNEEKECISIRQQLEEEHGMSGAQRDGRMVKPWTWQEQVDEKLVVVIL